MKNITYLIGAGASANALPILTAIIPRMEIFKQDLFAFRQDHPDYIEDVSKLLTDLNWIISQTSSHQTIDTFARKLFVKESRHEDLIRFKRILSCYFVYEQTRTLRNDGYPNDVKGHSKKHLPDLRYDSFISTLTSNEVDNAALRTNIKVLSWNYDVQFELAYLRFWDLEKLSSVSQRLQIVPSNGVLKWKDRRLDLESFAYIHLNGVIGYDDPLGESADNLIELFHNEVFVHDEVVERVLNFNRKMIKEITDEGMSKSLQFFNYAWEYFSNKDQYKGVLIGETIDNALEIARKTDILVVIGYSFPSFNRQTDKLIIDSMKGLRKIYIQDIYPNRIQDILENGFGNVKEYLANHPGLKFFHLHENLSQFIIPMEVWE